MDHDHAFEYNHSTSPYHRRSASFHEDADAMIRAHDLSSDLMVKMGPDNVRRSDECADPNVIFMSHHGRWVEHFPQDQDADHPPMDYHGPHYTPHSKSMPPRIATCNEHQFNWSSDNHPVSCRSDNMFDAFPHDYHSDESQIISPVREGFGSGSVYGVSSCNHGGSHSVLTPPPDASAPLSPQSNDWMSTAAREVEAHPSQKKIRLSSAHRSNSPIQRPDGIRKKNAKFEIPEDRNLQTLDGLIKNAPDEQSLKELKMQKRLLRNREAALHSRQKKKEHTMKLEGEQKQLHDQIAALEEQVQTLKAQAEAHERDRQEWVYRQSEAEKLVRQLEMEKETLVKSFSKETHELRNDISMLQTPATSQSSPLSTVPSTTEFSDFHNDVLALPLDGNDWTELDLVNDFCNNLDSSGTSQQLSTYGSGDPVKKAQGTGVSAEKSAASELLLTLVLVGAYVATKQSAVPISIPSDISMASPTVLNSFFADAGVAPLSDMTDCQATPRKKSSPRRSLRSAPSVPYKQCADLGGALDSFRNDNQVHSIASLYTGSILTRNARADVINNFKSLVTASPGDDKVKPDPDTISKDSPISH